MLHLRSKEQLLLEEDRLRMYPIKIEIHSEMKQEAELYLHKFQADKKSKNIKMRKIESIKLFNQRNCSN